MQIAQEEYEWQKQFMYKSFPVAGSWGWSSIILVINLFLLVRYRIMTDGKVVKVTDLYKVIKDRCDELVTSCNIFQDDQPNVVSYQRMKSYRGTTLWFIGTKASLWRENMLGYLFAVIICSKKRTAFRVSNFRKTVSWQLSENIFTLNGGCCVYSP